MINLSLTSGLGLLYANAFTVSRKNRFVNYDFQQLTLILGFCAPNVTMDSFLRTVALPFKWLRSILCSTPSFYNYPVTK